MNKPKVSVITPVYNAEAFLTETVESVLNQTYENFEYLLIDDCSTERESERYTKGMYGWIGFKKKKLTYQEKERAAGETKWRFSQLFKLAVDGITSYSTVPLRISSVIGIVISLVAFIFLVIEVIKILISGPEVAGYGTILAGVLFMGGIQLISLGIIGEYLSRIFIETKERPTYLIQSTNTKKKVNENGN